MIWVQLVANLGTTLRQQVDDGQEESLIANEQVWQRLWWWSLLWWCCGSFSSHENILSKTMNNLIFDWALDQGSSNGKKKKYLGKIKYRVDYDFITSTLTVTVIECKVGSKIKIQQNTKADTTLNITKYTRTLPQWTWMDFQTLTSASIFFLTTKRNLRQKSIGKPWTLSSMKPSNSQ